MDPLITAALDGLRAAGWTIELEPEPRTLPAHIRSRYPDLPPLLVEFATHVRQCERGDGRVWMLTAAGYAGPPGPDERAWDDFETMFLATSPGWDERAVSDTRAFWDRHLPIAQANTGDLEYLAWDREGGAVVHGLLIDFDSPLEVASDFADFLARLARVGRAEPTRSLIYAEDLALLIHPVIIEDGARPPWEKPSLADRLRRWFGG